MAKNGQISTILAGHSFADTLARSVLEGDQEQDITQTQILLPTRRGARTLRDSFVRLSGESALILPRLQTFGDIDEEALSLSLFCLLYTSPSPRDQRGSRMPSSA